LIHYGKHELGRGDKVTLECRSAVSQRR